MRSRERLILILYFRDANKCKRIGLTLLIFFSFVIYIFLMPPKKHSITQEKAQKVVEDKTFGLKNKKGAKQQKFISQLRASTKSNYMKKEDKQKATKSVDEKIGKNTFFKPLIVPAKTEKTVVCSLYKRGLCAKGDNCKFSHDLSSLKDFSEPKQRSIPAGLSENSTSIICKYFLTACEKGLFGPLWQCPQWIKAKTNGYLGSALRS
ncbi:zinc finger CCCH domain-containing protein 15 homolog [Zophobas morio]|uniref:zinc finger CCCH domain-containing protein 15 homolog n=1 Tax=Zophobas morio TaxID=2755281 RepID=UPI0030831FFE